MQRNSTRPVERKAFITSRPRRPLPTKAIPSRSFAPTTREYETAVIAAALTPTNQSLLFIFNPRKARSSLRLQAERRTASPAENLLERLTRGSDGLFPRFLTAQALFFNDRPARPIHCRNTSRRLSKLFGSIRQALVWQPSLTLRCCGAVRKNAAAVTITSGVAKKSRRETMTSPVCNEEAFRFDDFGLPVNLITARTRPQAAKVCQVAPDRLIRAVSTRPAGPGFAVRRTRD